MDGAGQQGLVAKHDWSPDYLNDQRRIDFPGKPGRGNGGVEAAPRPKGGGKTPPAPPDKVGCAASPTGGGPKNKDLVLPGILCGAKKRPVF